MSVETWSSGALEPYLYILSTIL